MPTELSLELRRAIHEQGGRPLEMVDPETNRLYVLVTREQYERLRPLFEDDPPSVQEQLNLLREAGRRAGWDDPEMDAYDRYDEAKFQPK